MRCTSCQRGATLVMALAGRLTRDASTGWLDQLTAVRPSPRHVIVDLAAVTWVDRDGADSLLDAYVATMIRAGSLALTGPPPLVRRQLDDFGVSRLIVTLRRAVALRIPPR